MRKRRTQCRSKSCVRARKRRAKAEQESGNAHSIPTTAPKPSLFEDYHTALNWIAEREQYSFLAALRRPLPTCFRIRSEQAKQEFQPFLRTQLAHAKQLPNQAWQLTNLSPELRQWLAQKTNTGDISRQEFVSMIPVLLLDIQPHHQVLDLCASPGSKTIQALDALYNSNTTDTIPTGFVIANELDPQRAYVLAHRCRATIGERMVSLAVVCHNATKFPNVLAPLVRDNRKFTKERPFDRIVCDVPCSGDGTLRKDLKVWKTWHPSYGIQLHSLQLRIAKRGIALLKVGGMMTYSTCSFHPIENEAVVAALLATGCVEVVPCDSVRALRGIRRRPGLTDWTVLDDECQEQSPQDRPEWPTTLWPPLDRPRALQRCIRMVPQDNDTGGFFIALLRKIKEFPVSPKKSSETMRFKIVTPQQAHHQLFALETEGSTPTFTRGPTGSIQYKLTQPLANFLTKSPGSAKLNLVSTGYKGES